MQLVAGESACLLRSVFFAWVSLTTNVVTALRIEFACFRKSEEPIFDVVTVVRCVTCHGQEKGRAGKLPAKFHGQALPAPSGMAITVSPRQRAVRPAALLW